MENDANTVNCSFNSMTKLPNSVLSSTEVLVMHGNNLNELGYADPYLFQVKVFDLQGNSIENINDEIYNGIFLSAESIKLSNNSLKYISQLLQHVQNDSKIWLGGNPFECNCDMMWMRDWLQISTNVMDRENITCGSGQWKGKTIPFLVIFDTFLFHL